MAGLSELVFLSSCWLIVYNQDMDVGYDQLSLSYYCHCYIMAPSNMLGTWKVFDNEWIMNCMNVDEMNYECDEAQKEKGVDLNFRGPW